MKSQGIRILDKKNGIGCVDLTEILKQIKDGNSLFWSILFLDVIGNLGEGRSNPFFSDQINKSKEGFRISWEDLNSLASKCEQVIDILVVGCKDKLLLQRYEDDQEMYEKCDIVIEMIDSTFWQVFSKDQQLISRLATRFKKTEFLETNFQDSF